MKTALRNKRQIVKNPKVTVEKGFSLIELTVAMAVFLIISSTAFTLFDQQQTSANTLQGQVGLNVALRNAVGQLQMDLSNAGSGYYQGVNIPSWPVGVTIVNSSPGTSCYNATTFTYGSSCFDQINIITAANPTNYPPINATDSSGGASPSANCSHTDQGNAYGQAAVVNGTPWTLAQTAAAFRLGDQLLFLNSTGSKITSVVLTANPTVSGSAVKLTFNPTLVQTVGSVTYRGYNTMANDPLDITACDGVTPCSPAQQPSGKLGDQFCGGDWILKLAPITYQVCSGPGSPSGCDQSSNSPDIADPKLERVQGGALSVVMEQVIGFKVGASIWNGGANDSVGANYNYVSSTYNISGANPPYDSPYNFTLVRSVRVSLIGRTPPNSSASYEFRNTFDGGPYQVQGTAVVVNPRNMSMND